MPGFTVLRRHWREHLSHLLNEAETDVFISSPYVTRQGADFVISNVSSSLRAAGRLTLLTNLSPTNITQGATDPRAIEALSAAASEVTIHHLPRLHAKVYVSDLKQAIVTSGNLTFGGLSANYEYGFCVGHAHTVEIVRRDIAEYAGLGASIDVSQLAAYSRAAERVRAALHEQQNAVAQSARRSFEEALRDANDELIKLRVAEGPIHTVFGKTIVYLLNREGPLSTQALHHLIREIHPDLCDDSVDRVIDGVRFGKKWKHAVRTAQQRLKRNGLIELHDGLWLPTT